MFCISILQPFALLSQDRYLVIQQELEDLSMDVDGLNNQVEISVSQVDLGEFLRGIAKANDLNLSIGDDIDEKVSNNFKDATVLSVILFLVKKHRLSIEVMDNIISITKFIPVADTNPVEHERIPNVSYDSALNLLSIDVKDIELSSVAKEISIKTGFNIQCYSEVRDLKISAYISKLETKRAIEALAVVNGLLLDLQEDSVFFLTRNKSEIQLPHLSKKDLKKGLENESSRELNFYFKQEGHDFFRVSALNFPIHELIKVISDSLNLNYFFNSTIQGNTTINLTSIKFDDFLENILNATEYTFNYENGIYLFGKRDIENLRSTRIIQLQHRSIEQVATFIPTQISKDVSIKEFPELNSLILSGSSPIIKEIELFLRDLDRVVPVVMIEVLLVDYSSSSTISTGLTAGISEDKLEQSSGGLYPSVDYQMNAQSVNKFDQQF